MVEEAPASVGDAERDRATPPVSGRFVFGRRASLLVSAGVVSNTLWSSAAPALTYRLYAEEWHLTHTVTAGIFAVFPIGVVVMLIGFGGISDHIGRRAAMLAALFASLVGALLSAVAPDVWWVFAGRILMGIGVGLSASPSTAAILEFISPEHTKSAASVTMAAQAIGFATALLLGGALTEYGPWPTRLCFWVLAVFLFILLAATWFLPRHTAGGVGGDRRSRMPSVPKDVRRVFVVSSTAMIAAYTFGVLLLSLGGQVEHDLIGSPNALLNGAVLSLFPIVMAVAGIVARSLSPRAALTNGALVSGLGMALLIVAVSARDLLIYLLATAAAGGAYSLLFVGGLQAINAAAPAHRRGGILSALYLLGYLSMGTLAILLGAIATTWGLSLAVDLGAAAIIVVNVATLVLVPTTPFFASPPALDHRPSKRESGATQNQTQDVDETLKVEGPSISSGA
jgi:predicted MFS family arabinose efflux permease